MSNESREIALTPDAQEVYDNIETGLSAGRYSEPFNAKINDEGLIIPIGARVPAKPRNAFLQLAVKGFIQMDKTDEDAFSITVSHEAFKKAAEQKQQRAQDAQAKQAEMQKHLDRMAAANERAIAEHQVRGEQRAKEQLRYSIRSNF